MIDISSPTRVDLAGGTLDLWPLYLMVGGASTVNLSIDIKTRARLTPREDGAIRLISGDVDLDHSFSSLQQLIDSTDPKVKLLQKVIAYYRPAGGFELETSSQSPVGGGLGGSSSLVMTLIQAFDQWMGCVRSVHEAVRLASNIEVQVLDKATGTQDYYPAVSVGLNILDYQPDGIHQQVISKDLGGLLERFMLIYTGKPHHSGMNNWEVLKSALDGDKSTLNKLRRLSEVSMAMRDVCLNRRWDSIPELFEQEFQARVDLSAAFSSPEIETLRALVLQQGGDAVKICGAGGGGCVLVWASPGAQNSIRQACEASGFKPLNAKPVFG